MYSVSFKDKSYRLTKDDLHSKDLISDDNKNYHLVQNQKSISAQLIKVEGKKVWLEHQGKIKCFEIKDSTDLLIEEMGFEINNRAVSDQLGSPMPGLVFDLMVSSGQEVTEGEPLLILEAMKMENVIKSPRDGIIKEVTVSKGESVEKSQILIKFQ